MEHDGNFDRKLRSSSSSCNNRSSSSAESTLLHNRSKGKGLTRKLLRSSSRFRYRKGKSAQSTHPRSKLTLLERLLLSSWEKWKRHNRFPFKLFLHVSLLALTLLRIGLYDVANSAYIRTSLNNWHYNFLLHNVEGNGIALSTSLHQDLYTLNSTIDALYRVRNAYFEVVNSSVANYHHVYLQNGSISPLTLTIQSRMANGQQVEQLYDIFTKKGDIGPFHANMSVTEKKSLLHRMLKMNMMLRIRDLQSGEFFGSIYDECYEWELHLQFKMIKRKSRIRLKFTRADVKTCDLMNEGSLNHTFIGLNATIAAVCFLYIILSFRAIRRSLTLISRTGQLLQDSGEREAVYGDILITEELPTFTDRPDDNKTRLLKKGPHRDRYSKQWLTMSLKLKLSLFNSLQVVIFVSLVSLLASSLWTLLVVKDHILLQYPHRLLYGSAILSLWITIVGYLEHNSYLYSIVLTLRWAIPRVTKFLVGVSPLFFGYTLFGTIYFGSQVEEFGSIVSSMVTLFAVMNGDVILDTFETLACHSFNIIGNIYLFSFIALSIYVVLNIFIALVEEAFFASRASRKSLDVLLSDATKPSSTSASTGSLSTELVQIIKTLIEKCNVQRDEVFESKHTRKSFSVPDEI
uniref:Mucolipinlike protein putative n=1 Tax=Albugo laibachii Nc14 TaxID=890382 RepID=F0WMN7_9STRA|nr:mucolipinlike protein putative [Albugo laibachii Nc14]|eukprot:CCA22571.1 mucolipinlike protein putative [Albugo laibachii Nc14]